MSDVRTYTEAGSDTVVTPGSTPLVHLAPPSVDLAQPVFRAHPARLNGSADRLFATGLCLPSGSGLSESDLDRVIEAARIALAKAATASRVAVGLFGLART